MISEAVYLHYLDALLRGDKQLCLRIVETLIDKKVGIKELYLELFQRSMYRIGRMWENSKCSIAEEHIATKITESLVDISTPRYTCRNKNGKQALITCVDKEFHETGAKIVTGFLESQGWNTLFLGANVPQGEVVSVLKERRPEIVGISNNYYMNVPRLSNLIESIINAIPNQEILIGGQAHANGICLCITRFPNVRYVTSIDELEHYLTEYKNAV